MESFLLRYLFFSLLEIIKLTRLFKKIAIVNYSCLTFILILYYQVTSTSTTTTPLIVLPCVLNPCLNQQPCLDINNVPTCYCAPQYQQPYCSSSSSSTSSSTSTTSMMSTTTVSVTVCLDPNPCNGLPCLAINGVPTCF